MWRHLSGGPNEAPHCKPPSSSLHAAAALRTALFPDCSWSRHHGHLRLQLWWHVDSRGGGGGGGGGGGPPAAWADGCWPPCVWTLLTYFTRYVEFCVTKVQMVVSELYLETTWTITVTVDYIAIDLLQLLHWIKEPFHSPGIGAVGPGHHDGNITHCNLAPWWGHLGKWDPLT